MSTEAMKLALDALLKEQHIYMHFAEGVPDYVADAITALGQAIAQQAQADPLETAVKVLTSDLASSGALYSFYSLGDGYSVKVENEQAKLQQRDVWIIRAPNGTEFSDTTPFRVALQASKYRLEIDPVAAASFAEAIETIRKEGEEEHDRCMREYGTLDCPACGGSGHIGDVVLEQQRSPQDFADLLAINAHDLYERGESQATQPAQVPAGYKLVPIEPTKEMEQAAMPAWLTRQPFAEVYRAMIAAAPEVK